MMFTLNSGSSAVLQKGQDSSGMGSWTYLTILGKCNRGTTIFTIYRPFKGIIASMGDSTVIKQQWLVMQHTKRKDRPHKAVILDIIFATKKKV